MFYFFRRIRRALLDSGSLQKYAAYAVGEIVLVVIGILIALQINNANEQRLEHERELRYLRNLQADLTLNVQELGDTLLRRRDRIESAQKMLGYFDGTPVDDPSDFAYHNVHVHVWQRFYQNNNTYQELINSGNLGIISNEAIKGALMDLELMYLKMKAEEDHMRFDFEGYVYAPFFELVDIGPFTEHYLHVRTAGSAGSQPPLSTTAIGLLLNDVRYKNGFILAIYMKTEINRMLDGIRLRTAELIEMIDAELQSPAIQATQKHGGGSGAAMLPP